MAIFTRQHYEAIAAALQQTRPHMLNDKDGMILGYQWAADMDALADKLAADNPAFDRAKFYKACGGR